MIVEKVPVMSEALKNPWGCLPNYRMRPLANIVLSLTSPKLHLAPIKTNKT